jgi:hypothetical protein
LRDGDNSLFNMRAFSLLIVFILVLKDHLVMLYEEAHVEHVFQRVAKTLRI